MSNMITDIHYSTAIHSYSTATMPSCFLRLQNDVTNPPSEVNTEIRSLSNSVTYTRSLVASIAIAFGFTSSPLPYHVSQTSSGTCPQLWRLGCNGYSSQPHTRSQDCHRLYQMLRRWTVELSPTTALSPKGAGNGEVRVQNFNRYVARVAMTLTPSHQSLIFWKRLGINMAEWDIMQPIVLRESCSASRYHF